MPNSKLPRRTYAPGTGGPLPPNSTHTPGRTADVDSWGFVRPQGRSIPAPAITPGQNVQVGLPPIGLVGMLGLQAATVPNQLDVQELLPVVETQQDGWVGANYGFLPFTLGAVAGLLVATILPQMLNPPKTQSVVAMAMHLVNNDPVNPYPAQLMQLVLLGPNGQVAVPLASFTLPAVIAGAGQEGPSVAWDAIGGSAGAVLPVPPGFTLGVQSVATWPSPLLGIRGNMWFAQISGQQRAR